jgi:hypothetical protein
VQAAFGIDEPIVWDEAKFNEVFVPLGIGLLAVMGIGPLISWRRATLRNFQRNFLWPLAWGSLTTLIVAVVAIWFELQALGRVYQVDTGAAWDLWLARITASDWLSVIVYWLCAFVMFSMAREYHIAARARAIKGLGGYLGNLLVITFRNPRRYGGYIIHAGIVFMFIAFTGKAFKTEEKDRVIHPGQTHVIDHHALTLVDRDRRYSEADGCVITDATFVVMPVRSSVSEASLERLRAWLDSLGVGAFHVRTDWDSPRMMVHFADPAMRARVLAESYLLKRFNTRFERQGVDAAALTQTWVVRDGNLLRAMPQAAMQYIREARDVLSGPGFDLALEARGGSAAVTLRFGSAEAMARFDKAAAGSLPEWVLAVQDDPEEGALAIVDRNSGQVMVPESRFFPGKGQQTTEVSLSQADFLVDVYLSVQSDMSGAPYVKVFAVVFPLVNFLWLGGFLMLMGAVVCLSPRWVGQTLQSFLGRETNAAAAATVASGAIALVVALAAFGSSAQAHGGEAPGIAVTPKGFPKPGADALAEAQASLLCGCPKAPTDRLLTLADPACGCPQGVAERAVVAELFAAEPDFRRADGRARYEVLKRLVALDGGWESRLVFDQDVYRRLVTTTRTTCPGEYLMTFDASKSTCEFKIRWLSEFRLLLAAGVGADDVFAYYVAENNATMAERQNGGQPWEPHELRTSDEKVASFWVPVSLVSGAVLLVLLLVAINTRRRRKGAATEREQRGQSLSDEQRERLRDEMELYDV